MRVVGQAPPGADFIEIVIEEGPLRQAMVRFSRNILLLSLVISAITAALVYLALHYLFVRPMNRLTTNMVAFREEPENPARIVMPSGRSDEIGIAERELGAMQRDLASMLQQKSHLAALGLAVSKINHDLRNLLASAQLFSDRLVERARPERAALRAEADALARARDRVLPVDALLRPGEGAAAGPQAGACSKALVEEVRETLGLAPDSDVRWVAAVERGLRVDADPDQLFRVILNLARNALQALEGARAERSGPRSAARHRPARRRRGGDRGVRHRTGRDRKGRARICSRRSRARPGPGGSGLGLAIAAELVRAHGGEIRLVDGTIGATFRIIIPDRAVDIGARRGERARA